VNLDLPQSRMELSLAKIETFIDWWLAPRWRALITWMALCWVSLAVLKYDKSRGVSAAIVWFSGTLKSVIGYSPSNELLRVCAILALLSWFQPVCLRLGITRCVLYSFIYIGLGLAVLRSGPFFLTPQLGEAVLVTPILGLPGLLSIGVRTRARLSPVGGFLSLCAFLGLTYHASRSADLTFLLGNLPYAVVMLYGTRLIRHQSN
jgi:hypothetical protein